MQTSSGNSTSFMKVFLKGEAVSTFWKFATKSIGLLNTFLTISSLSLYQYGVFQLLLSFFGIPSDILNLGSAVVSNEMSRAVGEGKISTAKRVFIEYTIIRLVLIALVWSIMFFGATYLFDKYDMSFIKDMRLISFLIISEGIFFIIRTLCLVKLEFGIVAFRATLNKIIQAFILLYFFIHDDLGLVQLIWSIILASAISVVLILPRTFKIYNQWKEVKVDGLALIWGIFWNYGKWDILRQFLNKITFRIKPWLIKFFVGTEAVAIFSIAELVVTTLQDILPSNTLQSLVPAWIKDKNLSVKMFSYGVKYYVLMGLIITVGAVIVVPPVINGFFPQYEQSLDLFYLMILNLPIFAAGILIGNYIIAYRQQKYLFFLHTFRNLFALTIILVTIPFIGLWGLAIEFVVVPLFMVISAYLQTKYSNRGFHFDFKIIFGFSKEDKEILRNIVTIIKVWFVNRIKLFQ